MNQKIKLPVPKSFFGEDLGYQPLSLTVEELNNMAEIFSQETSVPLNKYTVKNYYKKLSLAPFFLGVIYESFNHTTKNEISLVLIKKLGRGLNPLPMAS